MIDRLGVFELSQIAIYEHLKYLFFLNLILFKKKEQRSRTRMKVENLIPQTENQLCTRA